MSRCKGEPGCRFLLTKDGRIMTSKGLDFRLLVTPFKNSKGACSLGVERFLRHCNFAVKRALYKAISLTHWLHLTQLIN